MTAQLDLVVEADYRVTNLRIEGEHDGRHTMFATADLRDSHGDDCLSVWDVMVSVHHRGEGFGRRIMQAVIDYANERRYGLVLFVRVRNEVAIGLYESLGFTIDHTDTDTHRMVRPYQAQEAAA